uniref:phage tail tip protein J-related protein n=1 Tax=Pseudomonas viridiflava TaxID=33069 RepID=UPI001F13D0DE
MPSGVKKIAQVAVGAVIGFVQGGPVGAAIGAGLAFYAASQQEKLNTKSPLRDNEPSAQTVRSSKAPIRFILGRVSTGGVLVWAQEQSGTLTEGEQIHLVYVLCEGAIDGLENIYLGEEEIGSFGEFASYELIVNPTEVNAFLKANCQDWKDSQIGRGLSYVRITLKYSAEKFPSGIPDTRFVLRGRNDIYDPRTGNNIYTTNTALHILWFLRNRCNVPDDEIIFETFASAANVCDETLTNADGSVSQRYRTSCVIGADEQRPGVLQKLEASCAGKLIRVGGRWMLQAGAYYGPYDFEITEDMIVGTVVGSSESTNDSAINTVRGTFIDPEQSWTETDYPEVSVAEWILEDGGEAAETMTFPYVDDAYQPQRLANIALRQRRAGGAISLPMNFSGYNCRPGRVVLVNLPSLNIFGEFIVSDWSMGDNEGCTVQVKQYEAAIFDDAVGQPYNPLGFINLPSGGLGSPTGLAWAAGDVAEVVQGVLSWVPPQGIVTSYVVTVRQGANAVQSRSVPATANTLAINGLPSGAYTMSVAAVGPMARSGEATISVSIQGPPIPESCVVQSSLDSIVLIPQNPNHALNGGTYEYFFSTNPKATSGTAEYLGQGLSFTHNSLAFYTNYYYFIRSSNAYGKSAFLYVPASTSNDISAYLAAFAGKITETELGQEVLETIKLIDGDGPGSVNDRLAAAKSALAEQISDVDDALGTVRAELQEQIDSIADLADSMPYKPGDTYSAGQGVLGSDGIIYQATQNVPVNTPPPNTTYWLNVGQAVATAVGLASRVQTVETKVTSIEGVSSAQAKQITGLQSSLDGKASASSVQSLGNRVTDAEGKLSSQGSAITGINTELAGKASSATVQALGNTVTQQGQDIKAQGQAITSVTASLGNSGGQNLFFNPAFTKESAVVGVAEGWQVDVGTGGTHIASLVPSWLVSTEKAQRIDVSDLNQAAGYRSIRIVSASYRPKVTAGNSVVASCNVRATAGLVFAVFIQGVNAAGTDAVTVSGPRVVATGGTQRLVYDFPNLPAGTASVQVYFRLYGSDTVSAGFAEYTRAQLEIGTIVSGWKDNNAVLGADQSATSSAVAALSSSVSQQGATIIAQASSVQALQASSRDDNGDGDLADAVNGYNSAAGIVQEATVRATQNEATARTVTQLTA